MVLWCGERILTQLTSTYRPLTLFPPTDWSGQTLRDRVNVVAVQCETLPLEKKRLNVERMVVTIEKFGKRGSFVVFPELSVTGYGGDPSSSSFRRRLWEEAEDIPGEATRRIERVAKKTGCHVTFGLAERSERPFDVFNAAVLVGPEGYVGHVRKSHLTGEDDSPYQSGRQIEVFETELGRVGMMVCYDMWFPEVARLLALKGAELVAILSSAFAGGPSGGMGSRDSKRAMWNTLPRAIALTNLVHVVACNGAGRVFLGKRLGYWQRLGRTMIIDALGRTVAGAKGNDDVVVKGVVTQESLSQARALYSLLKDRVPELYGPLAE